ncbi:IS5 family transposase [Allosaccharopolyspora coralli]|uniref:IS5 family transposase n=1 Tax=Allosaccharopolyspora coralli TaxID=2665642 RepID=A0A5Q3Q6V3_9PSEU|nr:IS5 family transposase [Allosaccharopolyspora coralli]QGK70202.1 IS5 family transposase [Allosaccharopolyspora coralli]
MVDALSRRLVPDELWELVEPLIPEVKGRPQGGGRAAVDSRKVFTAIVYVVTSGCAWRYLPPSFGVTVPTAHRWFVRWTEAGLWARIHHAVLDELGSQGLVDWSRAVVDAAAVRAKKGGGMTGPSPVDRAKPGSKLHVLTDVSGLPLSTGISAANTADGYAMIPLVNALPAIRCRRGPRRRKPAKLHGDKAYNSADRRRWLRDHGIRPRLARKGVESSERLGRHRWVVERSFSWLSGYRRLTLRYERRADTFKAFLALAAMLVCFKRLQKTK